MLSDLLRFVVGQKQGTDTMPVAILDDANKVTHSQLSDQLQTEFGTDVKPVGGGFADYSSSDELYIYIYIYI